MTLGDAGLLEAGIGALPPPVKTRARFPIRERCGIAGCGQPTAEEKPFCLSHLDRLPYVRDLRHRLSRCRDELVAASRERGWKRIDPFGLMAQEVLDQI